MSPVAPHLAGLEDADAAVRLQAARELAAMGPAARDAVPALASRIRDDDARVAEAAARALGETRSRSAAAPLAVALGQSLDVAPSPRGLAAIRALLRLGRLSLPDAAGALLRAATEAKDPFVRAEAATALGTLAPDPREDVATAMAGLAESDGEEVVRKAAAQAADKLDARARPRRAAAALVLKGVEAEKAGRFLSPRDDCALGHALAALAIDPQSADAQRLRERASAAIGSEVRAVAQTDPTRAERLLEEALAVDPGRPDTEELRSAIANARQEEYRRTHVFRLVHKHGSRAVLGGLVAIGDGQTKACRGPFELLDDGFRFKTEETEDGRRDDIEFRRAQIKSAQIRESGRQLRIETTDGRFDFYGDGADLRRIQRALAP